MSRRRYQPPGASSAAGAQSEPGFCPFSGGEKDGDHVTGSPQRPPSPASPWNSGLGPWTTFARTALGAFRGEGRCSRKPGAATPSPCTVLLTRSRQVLTPTLGQGSRAPSPDQAGSGSEGLGGARTRPGSRAHALRPVPPPLGVPAPPGSISFGGLYLNPCSSRAETGQRAQGLNVLLPSVAMPVTRPPGNMPRHELTM